MVRSFDIIPGLIQSVVEDINDPAHRQEFDFGVTFHAADYKVQTGHKHEIGVRSVTFGPDYDDLRNAFTVTMEARIKHQFVSEAAEEYASDIALALKILSWADKRPVGYGPNREYGTVMLAGEILPDLDFAEGFEERMQTVYRVTFWCVVQVPPMEDVYPPLQGIFVDGTLLLEA